MDLDYNTSADSTIKDDIDHTESAKAGTQDVRYWLPNFESVVDDSNQTNVSVSGDSDFSRSAEPGQGDHFWIAKRAGDVTVNGTFKYQMVQKICRTGGIAVTSNVFQYTFKVKHLDESGTLITTYDRNTSGLSNWGEIVNFSGADLGPCPTTVDQDYGLQTVTINDLDITGVSKGDRLVFYMESDINPNAGASTYDYTHELEFYHNSL